MRYGSVCSGIEAASVAWEPLGWEPAWFAEIDSFASAVLTYRYPAVPNLGDLRLIGAEYGPIDLLVGGTPCQSFSVAGRRAGLDDPRGNLTLEYLALADRLRPTWLVWENVPGILSIDEGRTFGEFLGTLGQLGYGFAYRVLDAQFAGVPQRRRRVFVVGHSGGLWQRAAAVLLERHSLSGDPPPRREAGQGVAGTIEAGASRSRGLGTPVGAYATKLHNTRSNQAGKFYKEYSPGLQGNSPPPAIAATLKANKQDGTGTSTPLVLGTLACNTGPNGHDAGNLTSNQAIDAGYCIPVALPTAFESRYARNGRGAPSNVVPPLKAESGQTGKGDGAPLLQAGMVVRRLTPRECERLQGFPDDWTLVPYRGKPAADSPRYRALGNSMAVPCMAWIGQRIARVERAATEQADGR